MTVLISGGRGFIGAQLVHELTALDEEVVVVDSEMGPRPAPKNPAVKAYYDVSVAAFCLSGKVNTVTPSHVIHLAGYSRVAGSDDSPYIAMEYNVRSTYQLLDMCRHWKCRFTLASSVCATQPETSAYAQSKKMAEDVALFYAKHYDVPVTIMRLANVYGPGHHRSSLTANLIGIYEQAIIDQSPLIIHGSGRQKRDYIYINDVMAYFVAVHKKPNLTSPIIFDIGTGESYSVNQVADMFGGPERTYIPAPYTEAEILGTNPVLAQEVLDYTPQIRLEDYVSSFLKTL